MTTPMPGIVFPSSVMVEAGLVTSNPIQASTSLVLSDPVKGLLDTGTLGASVTWTDITQWVKTFTVNRPATRLQGPLWNYQASTFTATLDNSDGTFDPDNLSGPFVLNGATQLVPMVPIRVRAVAGGTLYGVFSGFADGWLPAQVTYSGETAELTLSATDAFKVLAGVTLPANAGVVGTGADTGARVRDILSRAGWYTSAERNKIDVGNSTLQGTSLGDYALNLMQVAVDSEIGQLYCDGNGAVVFRSRHAMLTDTRSNTVQAVFGDSPGTSHTAGVELRCSAVARASDDTTIVNDVQATRLGGTIQEVQDSASITKYLFPRTYSRTDLILQNDSDALNWAQWILAIGKDGSDRFDSIRVNPLADPANLWAQALGREIGDRIQVWHRPASVPAPVTKDCFVMGISHTVDLTMLTWDTAWTLQDASKFGSFMTLDNPTLGQLDHNALAF